MAKKIVVLDTSVFINNPTAYESFKGQSIFIPISVLEELDKLKKHSDSVGRNARVSIKKLDELSMSGEIHKGIKIADDTTIIIDATDYVGLGADAKYGDGKILACAMKLKETAGKVPVVLISRDINLRVKARALGLEAEGYDKEETDDTEIYKGYRSVEDADAGEVLNEVGMISVADYELDTMLPNEYVFFTGKKGKGVATGRRVGKQIRLVKEQAPWGLKSRNKEQFCAMDLLMDPLVPLVSLVGRAGGGKTLVALASGLEQVLSKKQYETLMIFRPVSTIGDQLGFLPGPQPLDAKIATPNGWTTMGELKVGSMVIAGDGTPTKVLGIYPKGIKSVYRVLTADGTSTECCEDHLWLTQTFENKKRSKPGSVKSTKEIMETLKNKDGRINHFLPRNKAVEYEKTDLPLPPYTLGALLGDGSTGNNETGNNETGNHKSSSVVLASTDQDLIDRVSLEMIPFGVSMTYPKNNPGERKHINYYFKSSIYNHKTARPVKITNMITGEYRIFNSVGIANQETNISLNDLKYRCNRNQERDGFKYEFLPLKNRWQNPIKEELYKLGLVGKKAWEKFIPLQYKYASIEDRVALLRGLMDTDGTVKKNGEASYCTTSKTLALDVIELVRSLGGRATLCERDRVGNISIFAGHKAITRRISYEFTVSLPEAINPFHMKRKAERHSQAYMHKVSIQSIEYVGEKEVQCILIDHPDHLYLTDNFIVTHNTLEDKVAPLFEAVSDAFSVLFSDKSKKGDGWKKQLFQYTDNGTIQQNPISYLRGRSIPKAFILVDEAQNITKDEIKTILTRAGEGTKIVLTGDPSQIDLRNLDSTNNGLSHVIDKFRNSELAGSVLFEKGERSQLATLAADIL